MIQQVYSIKVPAHLTDAEADLYINDAVTNFIQNSPRPFPKVRRPDKCHLHFFSPKHCALVYESDQGYKYANDARRTEMVNSEKPTKVAKL